jgi:anhydro-N-acetylmuramic acid kinase
MRLHVMRKSRFVIGLNSGTSVDGVDAAACEISGSGLAMRVRVLGHVAQAYSDDLRRRILAAMAPATLRTEEFCRLIRDVGDEFARAAEKIKRKLGLRRIDLIGSHGQTICHLPGSARGSTLQVGDAAVISARLGTLVVSNFRPADMAAGGQGAPLVPWTDYVLLRHPRRTRVVQNIGGIANLTWLAAGGRIGDVVAMDSGPGNMIIDGLVRRLTRGREQIDRGGRRARKGCVSWGVLSYLMRHPYIYRKPPKSCGREEFGESFLDGMLRRFAKSKLSLDDWLATTTFFSAMSIWLAYAMIAQARGKTRIDEVVLCGGGAKNATLVRDLQRCVWGSEFGKKVIFSTTDDHGIPAQAKECVSFAMLAAACVDGVPANVPQVTGAKKAVVLGQVCDVRARA